MKITELKIEIVTTETKSIDIHDPRAVDADEEGNITFTYLANLPKPMIRPKITIKMEAQDKALLTGGIYMFAPQGLRFVAMDPETLKQTEFTAIDPERLSIDFSEQPVLIAQAMKE